MRLITPMSQRSTPVRVTSGKSRVGFRPGWVLAVVALAGASGPVQAAATAPVHALTVLRDRCFSCHDAEKKKGGLALDSREAILAGSDQGEVLQPGRPRASRLWQVLAPDAEPHMPPKTQLERGEIRLLERWIKAGAPWNEAVLAAAPLRSVSLQPLPPGYQPAKALALARDDRWLAFGRGANILLCENGSTKIAVVRSVSITTGAVESLAWSADGQTLAVGGFRSVSFFNPRDGSLRAEVSRPLVGRVTALAFAAAGDQLVVADSVPGRPGWIRVLTRREDQWSQSRAWEAHADSIHELELHEAGGIMATAGADKLIKLWSWPEARETARLEGHTAAVLGLAFNADATRLASAGADRELKVWDAATREKIISLGRFAAPASAVVWRSETNALFAGDDAGRVLLYKNLRVHSGEQSSNGGDESQLADLREPVLRLAATRDGERVFAATHDGRLRVWNRAGQLLHELTPETDEAAPSAPRVASVSFVRDILPVLGRAGCNAGGCHAKPEGQNGFKLSVFTYDPAADYAEIVREARGRRVFPAAPEESLFLLKPTARLAHEGGERIRPGSPEHRLIVRWMREGMPYQVPGEAALTGISVRPSGGVYRPGGRKQLRVEARYADGTTRDVTALAQFDSSDPEMATVDEHGRVSAGQITGEGVVLARFMGQVADAKVTVPARKKLPAAHYARLPRNNFIDAISWDHFQQLGLYPSAPASDAEFLRRASLDAIGRLPTVEEAREFLGLTPDDTMARPAGTEDRSKQGLGPVPAAPTSRRHALIDRLLDDPAYADYWANKFADLLRPNPDRVGVKSVLLLDQWLREQFRANRPYDEFAREIVTAEGSNHRAGPAVIYRDRREPPELASMFSQVFLGVRMECAKCHHHPSEKWAQEDFYQLAAFFGSVKQKGAGLSPPISAGTETFYFAPGGAVKHPVTDAVVAPKAPDAPRPSLAGEKDPREAFAAWLTAADNPFFARAIVNRVWAVFFGRGLVEPVDDFRISNPCANQKLLDALAQDFVAQGHDLKHLMRTIMRSHLYQLGSEPNETNLADTRNFSRSYRRRLPAEVLMDAVRDATGVPDTLPALPVGSRAMQTWNYRIESPLLDAFGRPNSSSDCPCERDTRMSVVQSLHLMNATTIQAKLGHKTGRVRRLAERDLSPAQIVAELYLAALGRLPDEHESNLAIDVFQREGTGWQTAAEDVLWALLNSPEFIFNH